MAKRIGCPICSKLNVNYIMTIEPIREYDKDLQMPVTIFFHYSCKTKMRVTGVVCVDCGGTGDYETEKTVSFGHPSSERVVRTIENCPHCMGWGVIPTKFDIIPGDGPRPAGNKEFDYFNPPPYNDTNTGVDVASMKKINRRSRLFDRVFGGNRSNYDG